MQSQKSLTISFVIPAYNDEKTIVPHVIQCEKILKKYCKDYEIIIADDVSSDKTRFLLNKYFKKKKKFKIIFNKKNLGITQNIRQLYFLGKKTFIFFYSADGDWDPNDVEQMIKKLLKNNAEIVIGKRVKKIGYTPYRHIVSFFHKLLPIILFGVDTIDPGGIKIIKRNLAQINLVSTGQFYEAEMIIRAKKMHKIISWCPIIYKKQFYGSGAGGGFSDALHAVIDAIKLRFSRF